MYFLVLSIRIPFKTIVSDVLILPGIIICVFLKSPKNVTKHLTFEREIRYYIEAVCLKPKQKEKQSSLPRFLQPN